MPFGEKKEHKSFGIMGFTRKQSSGGATLFGSDLEHNTIISMSLRHAEIERDLSRNWYFGKDLIVEVDMTQNQFSEMITSMNMGDGIPVTVKYTEMDGYIDEPEIENMVETHSDEFAKTARKVGENAQNLYREMEELFSKGGTIKKADKERLLSKMHMVQQDINANMPFMEKQFAEAMDKTVTDAKGTIEAFYQHRVTEAGLDALTGDISPKLIVHED